LAGERILLRLKNVKAFSGFFLALGPEVKDYDRLKLDLSRPEARATLRKDSRAFFDREAALQTD
jgi:hypothetical protein